ncbi:MAG: UbiD family decarboxylase [Kyrpidia sp.]|nr:UbiD family decarboxylase [Kyrpidia sp.]
MCRMALEEESLSLRNWLGQLNARNELARVARTVRLDRCEWAAIVQNLDGSRAVWIERAAGHRVPLVAGICSRRDWLALAIGVEPSMLLERITSASEPMPAEIVPRKEAPVKQVTRRGDIDLARFFPIPRHVLKKDGYPWITAGVVVYRDPFTGCPWWFLTPLQVVGPRRLRPAGVCARKGVPFRDGMGELQDTPAAVVIGLHPALLTAAQIPGPAAGNPVERAGGWVGRSIEMVCCDDSELLVPARAEIVCEGRWRTGASTEGVPEIDIQTITHRARPIFQTILPGSGEARLIAGILREADLLNHLRRVVPRVAAVHGPDVGTGRHHVVVVLKEIRPGDADRVMSAALTFSPEIRGVVVVEDAADRLDSPQVGWAIPAERWHGNEEDRSAVAAFGLCVRMEEWVGHRFVMPEEALSTMGIGF